MLFSTSVYVDILQHTPTFGFLGFRLPVVPQPICQCQPTSSRINPLLVSSLVILPRTKAITASTSLFHLAIISRHVYTDESIFFYATTLDLHRHERVALLSCRLYQHHYFRPSCALLDDCCCSSSRCPPPHPPHTQAAAPGHLPLARTISAPAAAVPVAFLFLVFTTCSSAPLCPPLPFSSIHSNYHSALLDPLWKEAMLVELRAILDNDKWTLVSPPAGTSLVSGCVNTYSIQTALSSTTRLVASFMATPSSPPSIMASPSAPSSSCLPYMMGIG